MSDADVIITVHRVPSLLDPDTPEKQFHMDRATGRSDMIESELTEAIDARLDHAFLYGSESPFGT